MKKYNFELIPMLNLSKISSWVARGFSRIISSIAFYPAFIALTFLAVSVLSINFDFSDPGKQFKKQLHWLSLKDAATARSIVSVIAGGVISLTVFSFSMVMIMLNQAASQMTNRLLDKLIGNRFQQIVLGSYIGTIVFALFLLSTIRDVDSGISIPALSTYLLILLTVVDIFLFIYFLHYITQSVKYEVIIEQIYQETKADVQRTCTLRTPDTADISIYSGFEVLSPLSGMYMNFDRNAMLKLCDRNNIVVTIVPYPVTFILKGLPLIRTNVKLSNEVQEQLLGSIHMSGSGQVERTAGYGFKQLTEIALKALSPGINDPGTAILCLRAIFKLLSYRICYFPATKIRSESELRIIVNELPFDNLFEDTVLSIWDYGKNDRMIQRELKHLLTQLLTIRYNAAAGKLLQHVESMAFIL